MITNVAHGPNYEAVFARATEMFSHGSLTDHGLRTITLGLITSLIGFDRHDETAEEILERVAGALDSLEVHLTDRLESRELSTDSPFFQEAGVR